MKVIIAGSRKGITLSDVRYAMLAAPFDITEVVSGCAKGVDTFGEIVAREYDIPIKRFPAKWDDLEAKPCKIKINQFGEYNCLAGFNRNKEMADYGDALIAVWNGSSSGTRDMIKLMQDGRKRVYISTKGED